MWGILRAYALDYACARSVKLRDLQRHVEEKRWQAAAEEGQALAEGREIYAYLVKKGNRLPLLSLPIRIDGCLILETPSDRILSSNKIGY